MQDTAIREARPHVERIKGMLNGTVDHLEEDIGVLTEPHALALFETTREVLAGLVRAYDHYERGAEPAWRRGSQATAPAAPGAE
jgi:hypothetical protein